MIIDKILKYTPNFSPLRRRGAGGEAKKRNKPQMKLTILTVMMALSMSSFAQTQKITLNDAITKGLVESKTLRYDHSKIEMALAKYNQSKDGKLPDVKLDAGYTYLSDLPDHKFIHFGPASIQLYENSNYSSHLGATETIFAGNRERYAEQSTQYLLEASKLDVEKDKEDITQNIINTYFTLYKATQTKKIIDENIGQINQRLTEVQDAYNKGAAIQNDVLRVQLQLSNTQLAQIEINNNINVVNYNFDIMLGLPTSTQIELDSASMFTPIQIKGGDEYQKDALDNRMELRADNARTSAAQAGIKIAKSGLMPAIGIGADAYYANPNQRYFPILNQFEPTWDAGINLRWDLTGLFTNKHQAAEAQASYVQSQVAYDMHTDQIKMEVNSSLTSYNESLKKIEVAKLTVSQAEENYKTLTSRYNNHVALLSDLLDANNLLLQSKINETLAYADSELAYKNLLKATGNLK